MRIFAAKNNVFLYECACGVFGKCMFKQLSKGSTTVVVLTCPGCSATENILLSTDDSNINENDLSWSLITSNELLEGG